MSQPERNSLEERRRRALEATAGTWVPQLGDLAQDSATGRVGVVVAAPEDTGARVYHLRPTAGGGDDWAAREKDLRPHQDERIPASQLTPSHDPLQSLPGRRRGDTLSRRAEATGWFRAESSAEPDGRGEGKQ